jgi:hypothetical protein
LPSSSSGIATACHLYLSWCVCKFFLSGPTPDCSLNLGLGVILSDDASLVPCHSCTDGCPSVGSDLLLQASTLYPGPFLFEDVSWTMHWRWLFNLGHTYNTQWYIVHYCWLNE